MSTFAHTEPYLGLDVDAPRSAAFFGDGLDFDVGRYRARRPRHRSLVFVLLRRDELGLYAWVNHRLVRKIASKVANPFLPHLAVRHCDGDGHKVLCVRGRRRPRRESRRCWRRRHTLSGCTRAVLAHGVFGAARMCLAEWLVRYGSPCVYVKLWSMKHHPLLRCDGEYQHLPRFMCVLE